jgi:hypothetical protein
MSAPVPDPRLEAELKAMLQRRALDVDPEPPPWRELAQRNGAVVISLRTGSPLDADEVRQRRRPGRQWFRPVLAAAVTLALVMAAALLVGGGGGHQDDDTADGPIDVPAAGNRDFAASEATAFYPPLTVDQRLPVDDWITDPQTAARSYLAEVGLPVDDARFRIGDPASEFAPASDKDDVPIETATVAWSVRPDGQPDERAITSGSVFLRNTEQGGRNTWLVVGVMTTNLRLDEIQRGDDLLTFVVDRSADVSGIDGPARVLVDGEEVDEVALGEFATVRVHKPADQDVILQVEHVSDGKVLSVTATAVPSIPALTGAIVGPKVVVGPEIDRTPNPSPDTFPAPPDEPSVGVTGDVSAGGRRQVVVESGGD